MEWLKVNADGEMELTTAEVALVPELAALRTPAYNKGKGDFEGRKKTRYKQELKYLYLTYSGKSPYRDYSQEERVIEAKKDCNFADEWVESTELQLLIPKFIKGNKSKLERLLSTTESFLEKFEKHLNGVDLDERNSNGGLVNDATKIMGSLKQLPGLAQTLQELEQQVKLGTVGTPKSKGDHELGWMAMDNPTTKMKQTEEDED